MNPPPLQQSTSQQDGNDVDLLMEKVEKEVEEVNYKVDGKGTMIVEREDIRWKKVGKR